MKEIKQKVQKKCVVKTKLKFEDYKKCLKASKIINIVNYLEKKGMNVDSLKEHKNEFIKIICYQNPNKDLKVKGIVFLLRKLAGLR